MLIDAILKLHEKIQHEPLGAKRVKALEAAGATTPRYGVTPSSYRFDKGRRAGWDAAAAEGREEQFRIETGYTR
jgi:NADH-quinone oxidoreductase subunit B